MFEESFYLARQRRFDARLKEIEEGKAGEYLKRHDDLFRPKQTWCIGLKWDVCEQKQLLEIVEVSLFDVLGQCKHTDVDRS
jgi:Fanconi-associated nuclease 1